MILLSVHNMIFNMKLKNKVKQINDNDKKIVLNVKEVLKKYYILNISNEKLTVRLS